MVSYYVLFTQGELSLKLKEVDLESEFVTGSHISNEYKDLT